MIGPAITRFQYESDIVARLDQARRVPFWPVALNDGWSPKPNDCHNNVDTWVAANPGLTPVRGWLVESVCSLTAHSVVRDCDGQFFDVTPLNDECRRLGFVEHHGDEQTFFRMKALGVQIFHPPINPEELFQELTTMLAASGGEWNEHDCSSDQYD